MRQVRRFAAVLLTFIVATTTLAGPAEAAGTEWLPPATLSTVPTDEVQVDVAADGQGNAYAVWPSGTNVMLAARPAGGEWSAPKILSRHGRSDFAPGIAANAKGNVVIVWADVDSTYDVRAIRRLSDGSWSKPAPVSDGSHTPYPAVVAMDGNGNAFAMWSERGDGDDDLEYLASRMSASGIWSKPASLAIAPYTPREPSIAADADGNATAVWREDTSTRQIRLRSASWRPGEGWSSAKTLATGNVGDASVATAKGQAVVAWTARDVRSHVMASLRSSSGVWSTPTRLTTEPDVDSIYPDVGFDGNGNAVAVWPDFDFNRNIHLIRASRRPVGSTWQPATTLSLGRLGDRDDFPRLSVNRNGDAVAAWTEYGGGGIHVARMFPGGSWTSPETISASDSASGNRYRHDVAVDDLGNAIVGWFDESEGGRIRASQQDRGGPHTTMTQPSLSDQTDVAFAAAWRSVDAFADVAGKDVQYRSAPWNGPYGDRITWLSNTTENVATFTGVPGRTYCFSARATDTLGLVGPWSAERCTGVPLDDRALRPGGRWTRGINSHYYRGTYTHTKTYGATLTLEGVQGRYLALLATRCSSCGKVQVSLNGTSLGTFDLRSSITLRKRIIPVKTFSSVQSGQVKIRVVSGTGKAVYFDGLVVRR